MKKNAMDYASRGWKIFPLHTARNSICSCGNNNCINVAKHSRIEDWEISSTDELGHIQEWWAKWPDANIGVATGSASGFFAVDVVPHRGGEESLQRIMAQHGRWPSTMMANISDDGYNFFFKAPNKKILSQANVLPGIDVKGEGSFVVVPPSFHRSGTQYIWCQAFEKSSIMNAPEWLLELSTMSNSVVVQKSLPQIDDVSELTPTTNDLSEPSIFDSAWETLVDTNWACVREKKTRLTKIKTPSTTSTEFSDSKKKEIIILPRMPHLKTRGFNENLLDFHFQNEPSHGA